MASGDGIDAAKVCPVVRYAAVPRFRVLCRSLLLSAALGLLVACSGSSPTDPGGSGGRISGVVFADSNGNGTRDAGEPGLSGIPVELFQDPPCSGALAGSPVATVGTSTSGAYSFTGLATSAAGTCYVVRVTPPGSTEVTSENPRGIRLTDAASVIDDIDFGILEVGLGRVSGVAFADSNGNGVRDPGEPGAAGVTVEVFRDAQCGGTATGSPMATMTTPSSGEYSFDALSSSESGICYVVRATAPPDHAVVSDNPQGIRLSAAEPEIRNLDFGIHQRGLFFIPVGSPTANSLYLDLAQGSPGATTWRADLRASGVQNLYGVAFDLHYPEELLSFTDATEGPFLGGLAQTSMQIQEVAPGHLVVGLTRMGNLLGASGSGLLMSFDFAVAGDGRGEMTFTDTSAVDDAGQPKGFFWRGGSVLVLR